MGEVRSMLHHYQERRGEKLSCQHDWQRCTDPHVAVQSIRTYIQTRNFHNLGKTYSFRRSSSIA